MAESQYRPQASLVDLLDRVLDRGLIVNADIIISLAGVPLIGMGGIQYWEDAVEFLLAGASALAVGTALFIDPQAPLKILEGLSTFMQTTGCRSLKDLVGALELPGDPPASPYP